MPEDSSEFDELVQLAAAGDSQSWEALADRSRPRLRRLVAFRLDHRLQGRIDPSDVVQDAYLAAWKDLSPVETAQVLGIKEKAAGMRYICALRRIKNLLSSLGAHWQDA
jgi:DNA-directed RNA polymerase specialized sigma24 family protein